MTTGRSNRWRFAPAVAAALALVVGAAVAPPATASAAAEDTLAIVATDVSAHPTVRLVVAPPATLVGGILPASAITLRENGEPRVVTVQALPADQFELALVIDTSASMAGAPLAAAKVAATSLLNQLPPTVPVAVVGFGATPRVVSALSTDRAAQAGAVSRLTTSGETALYDALHQAVSQLPAQPGTSRVVVLLSDGGDTASTATLDTTARAMSQAGVSLFGVELKTAESNSQSLAVLASATGGRILAADDPTGLLGAFDAVARQLVRRYALTFRSAPGGETDLEIVLALDGVRATGHHHLVLPAAKSSPVANPAASSSSSASGSRRWAFVAGAATVGAALLIVLLLTLANRTPRARGLRAGRRGLGLSGAAATVERLGTNALRPAATSVLTRALEIAGLEIRPGEFIVVVAAATVAGIAFGLFLSGPVMALVMALLVLLGAKLVVDLLGQRRRRRFADQLPETLQMLSGALRAGHGVAQAVDTIAREAESPTAEEFRRLTVETRLGRDFTEALAAMGERVGREDFDWIVQAVDIHREVGGDLAQIFDSLGETIRARTRVRRQVAALSAEGKMSAWVLMLLPFGLGAVMSVTNPEYIRPLFHSGAGLTLLAAGAVLLTIGGVWLKRIVKPTF